MKKIVSKSIVLSMAFVLSIGLLSPIRTYAITNEDLEKEVIESELQKFIGDNNVNLKSLDINTEILNMDMSIETINGDDINTNIEIVPGSEYMTILSDEFDDNGNIIENKYKVKLSDLEDDNPSDRFINLEDGEEQLYNLELGTASFAPAIPIGIILSEAAYAALVNAGKVMLVSSVAYILATNAKKSEKYNHFQAILARGSLYIANGMSKDKAIARMKSGRDVWSKSREYARQVAAGANTKGMPINEVDKNNGKPKKGYYWHWHAYKRTPKAHSFYGQPV